MPEPVEYYSRKTEEVIRMFHSSEHGLASFDAKRRLLENGLNELPEARRDSYIYIFLRQFKSPLIYILLAAGTVVLLMNELIDALVIFFVLVFNACVGALQEGKAQNTFLALKKFMKGRAAVLRDGEEMMLSDKEIVPGDVIIIREGEKIPADARVIHASSLKVNEAALTGESVPKFKMSDCLKRRQAPVIDQLNMVWKGTTAVSGKGKALVVATGAGTFLGNVAGKALHIDAEFPLKNDIKRLSRMIILFVFAVAAILSFLGWIHAYSAKEIFKTIVAVSVSVIPEGLPVVMTLVLATGVWRMGKKHVLVKKLQAVEVLGETKVIAVDKTGTVTRNELVIEKVYADRKIFDIAGSGYNPNGTITLGQRLVDPLNHPELLLAGKIASLHAGARVIFRKRKKTWSVLGDPTEGAMLIFSKKVGFHRDDLLKELPIIDEMPFHYELKLHASLHASEKNNFVAITGSPEAVLSLAQYEWTVSGPRALTGKRRKELRHIIHSMSSEGLRLIGFAYNETQDTRLDEKNMPSLVLAGFWGMKDALREEVKEAVEKVTASGIKVAMITGDHESTAKAIAREAGIYHTGDRILNGEEIEILGEEELAEKIKGVSVFACVTPEHKLKIIRAYKAGGIVVAMTGDGVNDALSLSSADIGIGMGKIGTEVARESSDVILLDDNFGNIVHGVEEGRNMVRTLKKVISYLFSTSLGEVLAISVSLIAGFPLPILAVQILWLNLVTDGFLDVALAMEPKENNNEVKKSGISVKRNLVDKLMAQRMVLMSAVMALGTIILFGRFYENDLAKAWTISLTTLAVFQWFNAWNCRSETTSVFRMDFFSNIFLVGATGMVILLQLLAVYAPFMQKILRTVPLDFSDWLLIVPMAFSIVIVEEIRKIYYANKIRGFA